MKILMVLMIGVASLVAGCSSPASAAEVRVNVPGIHIAVPVPYVYSRSQCRGCEYGRYNGRVGWHRGHNKHKFHPMKYNGRYGYTNRNDYEHGRR